MLFPLLRRSCATYLQASSLPWEAKPKFPAEWEGLALASSGKPLFCPLLGTSVGSRKETMETSMDPRGGGRADAEGRGMAMAVHPEGHIFMRSMQASGTPGRKGRMWLCTLKAP